MSADEPTAAADQNFAFCCHEYSQRVSMNTSFLPGRIARCNYQRRARSVKASCRLNPLPLQDERKSPRMQAEGGVQLGQESRRLRMSRSWVLASLFTLLCCG